MLTHFMLQSRRGWLEKPVFPVMTFGVVLLSLPLPLQLLLHLLPVSNTAQSSPV